MLVVFCATSVISCAWGFILVNVASSNLKCKRKGCERENNLFLGSRKIVFQSFCIRNVRAAFQIFRRYSKGIESGDRFPVVIIFHLFDRGTNCSLGGEQLRKFTHSFHD